jgi:hypothetical protein
MLKSILDFSVLTSFWENEEIDPMIREVYGDHEVYDVSIVLPKLCPLKR